MMSQQWLRHPTLLPAVAIPFFTMQPAFGLGIAGSRTKNPAATRLKSLSTHTVYGLGLYLTAWLVSLGSLFPSLRSG